MARKGTLGYKAEQARRKGMQRLEQLNKALSSTNVSTRFRNWASAQKREITSAIQGTRSYSKEGKRYKTKTAKYIEQQISRLTTATEATMPKLSTQPTERQQRINALTQRQMNLGSLKPKKGEEPKPSIYNRTEVSVFYAVTRNIWEKPGIKLEDRNAAILQYFNEERVMRGLNTITLKDIMDKVIERNDEYLQAAKAASSRKTGNGEYDGMVEQTMEQQNEREKEGSPIAYIGFMLMQDITNQIYASLNVPNPADI